MSSKNTTPPKKAVADHNGKIVKLTDKRRKEILDWLYKTKPEEVHPLLYQKVTHEQWQGKERVLLNWKTVDTLDFRYSVYVMFESSTQSWQATISLGEWLRCLKAEKPRSKIYTDKFMQGAVLKALADVKSASKYHEAFRTFVMEFYNELTEVTPEKEVLPGEQVDGKTITPTIDLSEVKNVEQYFKPGTFFYTSYSTRVHHLKSIGKPCLCSDNKLKPHYHIAATYVMDGEESCFNGYHIDENIISDGKDIIYPIAQDMQVQVYDYKKRGLFALKWINHNMGNTDYFITGLINNSTLKRLIKKYNYNIDNWIEADTKTHPITSPEPPEFPILKEYKPYEKPCKALFNQSTDKYGINGWEQREVEAIVIGEDNIFFVTELKQSECGFWLGMNDKVVTKKYTLTAGFHKSRLVKWLDAEGESAPPKKALAAAPKNGLSELLAGAPKNGLSELKPKNIAPKKSKVEVNTPIQGLYGCSCHPFDSWDQCNKAHKQKFKVGDPVINRCNGDEGTVLRICQEKGYVNVVFPKENAPIDQCLMHVAQLMPIKSTYQAYQNTKVGIFSQMTINYIGGKDGWERKEEPHTVIGETVSAYIVDISIVHGIPFGFGKDKLVKWMDDLLLESNHTIPPKKALSAVPKKARQTPAKDITDSYPGGKNGSGIAQFLINNIPPVDCIVSGFLGHDSILKNIKPAKLMVGIDTNKHVIDTWAKSCKDIKLICDSFLNQTHWINPVNFGKTLCFIDMPYLLETRKIQLPLYQTEFNTPEQHKEVLQRVVKFPCYVMITHYECELYDAILLPKGFRKVRFKNNTRGGVVEEILYLNFEPPTELHDYQYFGKDYRERWNNKRIIKRTIGQLTGMDPLRRNMIIDSIKQHFTYG